MTVKATDYAVAIVLRDHRRPDQFLMVKRPDDDADHAGVWGLPAISLQAGELVEEAAKRVAREKLGCEAVPLQFLGAMFQRRNAYDLFLLDIEMMLVGQRQPDVRQALAIGTAYTDQRWSDDPMELMPSARQGSCCSSIFLTSQGLLDRSEWIASLEGSNIVG